MNLLIFMLFQEFSIIYFLIQEFFDIRQEEFCFKVTLL